jgi:hypothetical protein
MFRLEIKAEEEHRIDRILIRAFGRYDWTKIEVLQYFNPTLDILWLVPGTYILIPNEEEMREVRNYKSYYSLVRN